ncbi:MAG: amino acid transporter [Acidobacteria bacterium]|nr:MAG: amino acid transporter [Acidobacteriota bacterium]
MPELIRTLRLRDLVLLIIGAVIGSGIFLVPAGILNQVDHSVITAALVWIFGGILCLLGALTYGELAAMKPEAGGLYVYIRDGFGPLPAFLYGWSMFLAVASGSVSALAVAFSTYLGAVIPLGPWAGKLVAIAVIAVVTAVNVWGTRRSSDLQNWTTLAKTALILGISATLLALGRGYSEIPASLWSAHPSGSLLSSFGLAMITVLWAYEGWQFSTYSAGEALNPRKDFPRALFSGVVFLIGVYLLANVGYLAALGPERAGHAETIAAASISAVVGPGAAKIVALTILISVFSAANSVVLTAPRVFYAMSKDGLFFPALAEVHPRFRTPAIAIIALGIWSAFLACLGRFQELINYAMFVAWIFYGLAAAAIFSYRRRHPELERPYRVPGYPWTPLLFVLAAALLVVNAVFSAGKNALIGLTIVGLGLPAYFLWRRRRAQLPTTTQISDDESPDSTGP